MSSMSKSSLRRHRLTSTEYHRMADAGILPPDARVELIEGEIIDLAPIGSRHAAVVERLAAAIRLAVGRRAMIRVQQPVVLDEHSEPQPDLSIVLPRDDYYEHRHPHPEDVLLIVEVADTTQTYDRDEKVPLYARHRIREVWLVDLERRVIERYADPSEGAFTKRSVISAGEPLRIDAIDGVQIDFGL